MTQQKICGFESDKKNLSTLQQQTAPSKRMCCVHIYDFINTLFHIHLYYIHTHIQIDKLYILADWSCCVYFASRIVYNNLLNLYKLAEYRARARSRRHGTILKTLTAHAQHFSEPARILCLIMKMIWSIMEGCGLVKIFFLFSFVHVSNAMEE